MHTHKPLEIDSASYQRVLWAALVINALMCVVEIVLGLRAHSQALLADSIDFLSDATNYALTLMVFSRGMRWRAHAAQIKGGCMLGFGFLLIVKTLWSFASGSAPQPLTMGLVGALAFLANVSVALMLYTYRNGDANRRSVWLCTRNDAIGNLAVMLPALGVAASHSAWPDWVVASIMATLAISGGWSVLGQARRELAQT
jgi:Co/Zn/Cd efflux system component